MINTEIGDIVIYYALHHDDDFDKALTESVNHKGDSVIYE